MLQLGRIAAFLTLALFLAAPALAGDEDLKTIEKKIQESWEKHKTVKCDVKTESRQESPGGVMISEGTGTFELARKNDKMYARYEMTMSFSGENMQVAMTSKMLMVTDGEFTYTLSEAMGQKMAAKSKIDPKTIGDPKDAFEALRKQGFTFKLLPEAKINDRAMYVIEATPKEPADPQFNTVRYYFDKEDGFMRKFEMVNSKGAVTQTTTNSEVKFDVELNADRFKFEAPEGVTVMDRTKDMPMMPTNP